MLVIDVEKLLTETVDKPSLLEIRNVSHLK